MQIKILAFVAIVGSNLFAADKISIISPHRKSIQQEFIPGFKKFYKSTYKTDVQVDWIDQGGTSDDIRFIKSKFKSKPASSGIDIFWGGGTATFLDLKQTGLLAPHTLPANLKKEIPADAAGIPIYDSSKTWYGSAMSSFGIFYNRKLLEIENKMRKRTKQSALPEPKTWADLAEPGFIELLSVTDPRRSGTFSTMFTIILQSLGWEKGWEMLSKIAGNTRQFTHSSSDPIKSVVSGDAVAALSIDFYAQAKIADLGVKRLGFAMPEGQTILDPDPIAILKGAPNRKVAERFVNYVLSKDAQKFLVLPKGAQGGPKLAFLGRMAVNKQTYAETEGKRVSDQNPFKMKAFLKLDVDKSAKTKKIFNDLVGAIMVDTHKELKQAWAVLAKRNATPAQISAFARTPITEAEMLKLSEKWNDEVFRNKKINEWVAFAKKKFENVKKGQLGH